MRCKTTRPTCIAIFFVLTCAPLVIAAQEEHNGTIVLKVDGKEVKLGLTGGFYASGSEFGPANFLLEGEHVHFEGDFDVNGDGKTDAADRIEVDQDDVAKPESIQSKTGHIRPADKEPQNQVTLPGLGKMKILKGSTFTVTRYKKVDGVSDRWTGTVKLVLKGEKGEKTVTGEFECGTGGA